MMLSHGQNEKEMTRPKPRRGEGLVILEGGISAGKTTTGKLLAMELAYHIDRWLNPTIANTNTLLAVPQDEDEDEAMEFFSVRITPKNYPLGVLFIEEPSNQVKLDEFIMNPKRLAYSFQRLMLQYRLQVLLCAMEYLRKGYFVILDRSLYGDRVFELVNWQSGNLTDLEHQEYLSCYSQMLKDYEACLRDATILYIPQSEGDMLKRLQIRDRGKEVTGYPLGYLNAIRTTYANYDELMTSQTFTNPKWEVKTLQIPTFSFLENSSDPVYTLNHTLNFTRSEILHQMEILLLDDKGGQAEMLFFEPRVPLVQQKCTLIVSEQQQERLLENGKPEEEEEEDEEEEEEETRKAQLTSSRDISKSLFSWIIEDIVVMA